MDIYNILALCLAAAFYMIYLIKAVVLKMQGTTAFVSYKNDTFLNHLKEFEITILSFLIAINILLYNIFDNFPLTVYLPNTVKAIGATVSLFGIIIFIISAFTMRKSWRMGIDKFQKTELITNGIYKISRNPAFCGFIFFNIGELLINTNVILILLNILYIVSIVNLILAEEKYLTETFGNEYIEYKKRTGRFFIFI